MPDTSNSTEAILSTDRLTKSYATPGGGQLTVLSDATFSVAAGSSCAIVGPSGSGKTTLLGLCAGLDSPTSGSITLCGRSLSTLNEDALASMRNELVGFVFQNFQLLPTLTALENVLVPLELRSGKPDRSLAKSLLEKVGLGERLHHYPVQLSGGEQQRVALARAFVHKPKILFADEPTGNLDAESGQIIERMLFDLNHEAGTTLVIVTHDLTLAQKAGQIVRLAGGKIVDQEAGQA